MLFIPLPPFCPLHARMRCLAGVPRSASESALYRGGGLAAPNCPVNRHFSWNTYGWQSLVDTAWRCLFHHSLN
jgi:hypothetical protein